MPQSLVRRPANWGFLWPGMLVVEEMPVVGRVAKELVTRLYENGLTTIEHGRDEPVGSVASRKAFISRKPGTASKRSAQIDVAELMLGSSDLCESLNLRRLIS